MKAKEVTSVQQLIEQRLLHNQDKLLFSQKKGYRTHSLTGRVLYEKIQKTRHLLQKHNLRKGDKVFLFGNNSLEWLAVYFACILSSVVVVPLDTLTDKVLLRKIQKQVKAKAIFQDQELPSLKMKTYFLEELDALLEPLPSTILQKPKLKADDILEIIYTSGTTSDPKGVVLTHRNITSGITSALASIHLQLPLKMLHLLPLSHIFGQVYGLFLLLHFGHHIFFLDSLQPKTIIAFIKNKGIHGLVVVPGILANLQKAFRGTCLFKQLGWQFRFIGVGGASLDVNLEKWFRKQLIVVIQGYGLTETSSVLATNSFHATKVGSVGKVAKDVRITFTKEREILIKGAMVTPGYYQDREKTKASFTNKWFKTGDIGYLKRGYLYITGRKKDVIISSSGLNVYPVDIEQVLHTFPSVKESCVLEKDGQIHAVLLLENKTSIASIIKKANKRLLNHQQIKSYSLWPYSAFPKTPLGKLKKYQIATALKKDKAKKYSYQNRLYTVLNNVLQPHKKITKTAKLVDLGMDSLKRVELLSAVESTFGAALDEQTLHQRTTVATLAKLIQESHVQKVVFKAWPLSFLSKVLRTLVQRLIVFPILSFFTQTTYSGLHHLQQLKTPVIFASNHQSALDTPIIMKNLSLPVAVAADADYVFGIGTRGSLFLQLYRKLRGWFVALFFTAYPFGQTIGTHASFSYTGELLDRGYSILLFPEAHRTRDGKMLPFKQGIGYVSLHMGVPVIPVKVEGLFSLLPLGKFLPRFGRSRVKIGKPIKVQGVSYVQATKVIEKQVREL